MIIGSLYSLPDMYVKDVQTGICAKDGEPVVEKESAATALVDGKNLLGPVVGNFCMNLAIKKAKEAGIGWVVAHGEHVSMLLTAAVNNCCTAICDAFGFTCLINMFVGFALSSYNKRLNADER